MTDTQSKKLPVIVKKDEVVVILNNQPHTFKKTNAKYEKIVAAIKASDWDTVVGLIDITRAVATFAQDNIVIKGGQLFYENEVIDDVLGVRIVEMIESGFPADAMIALLANLRLNPSNRAVREFYPFAERNNMPITEDGCFIAYKKVRKDAEGNLKDIYTGKIINNVGTVVSMPRNKVDDESTRTCSHGLHVCSMEYLKHYGNKDDVVVLVKVNPKDVVSIPADYHNTKMRVCEYTVLSVFGTQDTEAPVLPVVVDTADIATPPAAA